MRTVSKLLAAALLATALASAAPAAAQVNINTPHHGHRPMQLDLHGGFTWWGFGFAGGARFGIPIVENGFIDSLNNAFYINFGADFYFIRNRHGGRDAYDPGFGIPVTAHWEFYFSETWSLFGEIGANVFFHPAFLRGDRGFFEHDYLGAWFIGAVGARLHIGDHFGLVLRVGNPYSAFGFTFFI